MADLPCILVVEDDSPFGQALVSHLARLDAFAVVAADVPEAIGLLEQVGFDLVITDYHLPHGTGSDVRAFIEHRFPDLPVVLISEIDDDEGGATPAAGVFSKQFLVEALPFLVERARGEDGRVRGSAPNYAMPAA